MAKGECGVGQILNMKFQLGKNKYCQHAFQQ